MSDLRTRIPDVPAVKSDNAIGVRGLAAADNPRGNRGGSFDSGRSGGKSDSGRSDSGRFDSGRSSAGRSDSGRSESGKFDSGKSSTGKSDSGRFDSGKSGTGRSDSGKFDSGKSDTGKFDSGKSSTDRPKISDLRKRIPDVSDGKTKRPDASGKAAGDTSKVPGTKKIDGGKMPDLGGKTGVKTPLDMKPGVKDARPGIKDVTPGMKIIPPGGPGAGKGKGGVDTLARARFPDRVKTGELDALTKGAVGQKIKLADQYRLAPQGDVARRLALHSPGIHGPNVPRPTNFTHPGAFHPHPDFRYHGWVSPVYHRHCFEYHSWFRPGWYPSVWWYPRWNPWVHWSWYHHCHPFWDPRPIWCRPIAYVVVPQPWIYWDYPVWTPLPAVASGTWVEVQRPVVPAAQQDLQVLAVRFVDPGHPDEKLGPRYRVWFRNNSNQAITQPFDVRLFATPGEQLAGNVPQAGVRVTAIEAGDTQSVDIRLPFEATQAPAGAQDKAPFQYVHAIVDANREIQDVDRANNGARVATADVLPVDPAAFETDPTTVASGGEMIVAGEGFGPEPGKVIVHLGNIEMEAQVLGWYDLGVRLKMPDLPLAGVTKADLVVVRGDGAAANPLSVTVNPPDRNAPAPEINAPPPQMNAPALPPVPAPPKPAPVK